MSFMELYGYTDDVQSDSFEFPEYKEKMYQTQIEEFKSERVEVSRLTDIFL